MCEKVLLEKIQGLEEHVQLASAREKEVVAQREAKNKQDVESMKWKALALEQLAKAVLIDQLLENQGEELFVILIEVWLPMV
jgi:hypothetical protein